MDKTMQNPKKIAIIGAGFSGTAVAANIHDLTVSPCEIILFEKTGLFATGEAYRTPYLYHLLNVRASDMSVFEDKPTHFVDWLARQPDHHAPFDSGKPLGEQFVPRCLYGAYLKELIQKMTEDNTGKVKLRLVPEEVIDVELAVGQVIVRTKTGKEFQVDNVVFALGNNQPARFPFPVAENMKIINDPWDFTAPARIPREEAVLIIGTGLSMIDTVLTLNHHGHHGKIYALSRHGLLPLPHTDHFQPAHQFKTGLTSDIRKLTRLVRDTANKEVCDWRSLVQAMRKQIPDIWAAASLEDKKRFIRHVLPYWNVHRHRVHKKLYTLLQDLSTTNRLNIFAGRVLAVDNNLARIKLRNSHEIIQININWLINCMGPALSMENENPLIHAVLKRGIAKLDPLHLGFEMGQRGALLDKTGASSSRFFTLGPPAKSATWESSAVPEIRKQCFELATSIIKG